MNTHGCAPVTCPRLLQRPDLLVRSPLLLYPFDDNSMNQFLDQVECGGNEFGSVCRFECSGGQENKLAGLVTCGHGGFWNEDLPPCPSTTSCGSIFQTLQNVTAVCTGEVRNFCNTQSVENAFQGAFSLYFVEVSFWIHDFNF